MRPAIAVDRLTKRYRERVALSGTLVGQELDRFGSATISWSVTISALAFVAFLAREITAQHPLVDLSVFLNRNFAVGTGLITLLGALLYGHRVCRGFQNLASLGTKF